MREAQTREICGRRYEVRPLPGKLALRIGTRMAKIITPIVVGLVGADVGGKPTLESVMAFAGRITTADILGHVRDTDLEEISMELAKVSKFDRTPGQDTLVPLDQNFDTQFAGSLDEWMQWFVFAVEVSFGPFVEGLKAKLVAAKSPSVAAPAST